MEMPNTDDQYNLKWNNHLANFVHTFIEHQNGESLVDVTLSCEGQYIKAHKLILSACSDYFHSIFQVHNTVSHPFIFLNGVRFVDLKYILHFMYHGEVKVVDKDLPSVLALGETLQIKGLSSVKIRDMPPPESGVQSLPQQSLSNTKPIKELPGPTDKHVFNMSLPPLPSEVPYQIPNVPPNYVNHKAEIKVRPESSLKYIEKPDKPSFTNNSDALDVLPSEVTHSKKSKIIEPAGPIKVGIGDDTSVNTAIRSTTPKTPHAFMLFTNEWRKKLLKQYPGKSKKELSIKLGNMWKNLLPEAKNAYYEAAKKLEEGNSKYPKYIVRIDSVQNNVEKSRSAIPKFPPLDPMEIVEIQEGTTDSE